MSTETKSELFVVTPPFRMAFPELLEPVPDLNKRLCNQVVALFPANSDLSAMRSLAEKAALAKWPKKETWKQLNKGKGIHLPFSDGNSKGKMKSDGTFQVYKGHEDTIVVNMKRLIHRPDGSRKEPLVVVQRNHKVEVKPSDKDEVYGGRWARAQVSFFAYDQGGNQGVACALQMVQLLDHDEPLGPARGASSVFDDDLSENTPTAGNPDDFMS